MRARQNNQNVRVKYVQDWAWLLFGLSGLKTEGSLHLHRVWRLWPAVAVRMRSSDRSTSIIYFLFISVCLFNMKGDNPSAFLYVYASDKVVVSVITADMYLFLQWNYCIVHSNKRLQSRLLWTVHFPHVLECPFLCRSTGISVGDHCTSQPWHWACPFFCCNTSDPLIPATIGKNHKLVEISNDVCVEWEVCQHSYTVRRGSPRSSNNNKLH